MAVQSTQSRATVQAELFKARADGSIAFARDGFYLTGPAPSACLRERRQGGHAQERMAP